MRPVIPGPSKIITSILTGDRALFAPVLGRLCSVWGPVDFISRRFDFNETGYYEKELGTGLERRIVSFENLVPMDGLSGLKTFSNEVEQDWVVSGLRRVNIDPGFLTLDKFVLASCKNFSHRIYLGAGVFAELTLIYTRKGFVTLPWTYPDYGKDSMKRLLTRIRARHAFIMKKEDGMPERD